LPAPLILIALALLFAPTLAGCAAPVVPDMRGGDPSDADAKVSATGYRPVIESYRSQRPVGPADWRDRNDRVAPAKKKGSR
jgi:hypothetical protein